MLLSETPVEKDRNNRLEGTYWGICYFNFTHLDGGWGGGWNTQF